MNSTTRLPALACSFAVLLTLAACAPPPPAAKPPAQSAAAKGPRINLASKSGDFESPLDSTPDPSGKTIYFIAENSKGKGLFQVASEGGEVAAVALGAPFVGPTGLSIAPDGQQIYIADPAANSIFAIEVGKGMPVALPASAKTAPQNLDAVLESGQPMLYFSGKDPQDGQAAIFKMAANADKPMVVFKGAPLNTPDGIAVAPDGTVYVADRASAGDGMGQVFKIVGGKISTLVDKVRTGNPAGIALTQDGGALLVSAMQPDGKSDQVLVVNTSTGATTSVTDVVGQNSAAGGVHRAYTRNFFSWADRTCRPKGCVFGVEP